MGATRYRIPDHVFSTGHGPALVMMNLATDEYFSLNEVGRRCWSLLADGCGSDEVASQVSAEFATPLPRVQDAVERLMTDLQAAGLIVPTN
jgi:hypothetical protein